MRKVVWEVQSPRNKVLSCAPPVYAAPPLLPAPGHHWPIPAVLLFPGRTLTLRSLGVRFRLLCGVYLRPIQVAWMAALCLLGAELHCMAFPSLAADGSKGIWAAAVSGVTE